MKSTCETIAVEGGAEEEATTSPAQQHHAEQRLYDLLHQVVKHIPRRHRIGWYQTLARYARQPLSEHPTAAELAYRAWSEAKHTSPRSTPADTAHDAPNTRPHTPTQNASADTHSQSSQSLTSLLDHTTPHTPTVHEVIDGSPSDASHEQAIERNNA